MPPNNQPNYVERPPRIQPELPIDEIKIPSPPNKNAIHQQSIIEMLLPMATIGAYLLLAISGRGRSIWLMLPMSLAMLGSVFVSMRRANQARDEAERKRKAYAQRLVKLRSDLKNHHRLQRDFYHYNYPTPRTVISIAAEEELSRSGSRIWERRLTDQDFGVIRLGVGTRRSTVQYTIKDGDNDEDPQMNEALRLAQDSENVDDVPITLQVRPPMGGDSLHDVQHTVGIYSLTPSHGQKHVERFELLYDYVRALLLHFTVFHSPRDAHLYVIGTRAASDAWGWAQPLQHVHMGQNREEDLLCFEGETVKMDESSPTARLPLFLRELRNVLITREQRLRDQDVSELEVTVPHILVVVDLLGIDEDSLLQDVESNETISMILSRGRQLGVSALFLTERPDQIPSDTQAIIELETLHRGQTVFRYAEVGMNSPRYVGTTDLAQIPQADRFVEAIWDFDIRASAAASVVSAVDLLEMNGVVDIDQLEILENWRRSRVAAGSEWPQVPIGMKNANEPPRDITFSANKDGVHAMIAGTTGSGKSEMLLTLIVGLAINYDPSVVNFVLVDFKGGAAFEEFKALPHCVDIVTNLEGNAVDRMFAAIKAELDRRGEMVAQYKVKHIVDYRAKNYHKQPPDFVNKQTAEPFPHLFIIVDEFAEMVSENPEYKAQLDSITRLGRAIGVSLVLATQKPGNAITDQMRANMKLKICLRVETPEDSRELLRRSDAAFLPTSIPGRAYVQIGNEPPELVQIARAGGPYRRSQKAEQPPVIWHTREKPKQEEATPQAEENIRPISTVIVETMQDEAEDPINEVSKQRKPWPNPLPKYLPLGIDLWSLYRVDPTFLPNKDLATLHGGIVPTGERTPTYLSPAARPWITAMQQALDIDDDTDDSEVTALDLNWQPMPWNDEKLAVSIGLIDHPRQAQLRLLNLSLLDGNIAVMSTSGWGKTTFLRTLMTALATKYPPTALHMYVLDFGGRNLSLFKSLPHVGAVITPDDTERVDRLLRFLNNTLDERKEQINNAGADDLVSYNIAASNPDSNREPLPAILVLIDNYAEIKDNFEPIIPVLLSLFREGRNMGIYFAATADSPGTMGGKSFALYSQRFALRQPDKGAYLPIVGRGAPPPIEAYGRGLMTVERSVSDVPLEFQVAAPVPAPELAYQQDQALQNDEMPQLEINEDRTLDKLATVMSKRLETLVAIIEDRWQELTQDDAEANPWTGATKQLPEEILRLQDYISLDDMISVSDAYYPPNDISIPIGTRDIDLSPLWIGLENNPHFAIIGPPLGGRTTMLRSWILLLAQRYPPQDVAIVMVDLQKRLHDYKGGSHSLADLPHVRDVVTEEEQIPTLIEKLIFEFEFPRPSADSDWDAETLERLPDIPRPQVFIFIDNYNDLVDILKDERDIQREYSRLSKLARSYGTFGLHLVICGSDDLKKTTDSITKQVWQSRLGFSMKLSSYADGNLKARVEKSLRDQEFESGRGLFVQAGRSELAQIATPEPANKNESYANALNQYVQDIQEKHADAVAAFNTAHDTDRDYLPWYYDLVPEDIREPEGETDDEDVTEADTPTPSTGTSQAATPSRPATSDRTPADSQSNGKSTSQSKARSRRQSRQEIKINQMRGLLSAERLAKMPESLLAVLPLRYEDEDQTTTASILKQHTEAEIEQWLDDGTLKLPDSLEDGLRGRVNDWRGVYDKITGRVITTYPLSFLLNELEIDFGEHDPADVQAMPAEQVQALIDSNAITLPDKIEHRVLMSLQIPPKSLLKGEIIAHLAQTKPERLHELGIELGEQSADDISQMSPAQIEDAIEAGEIQLPIAWKSQQHITDIRNLSKSLQKAKK